MCATRTDNSKRMWVDTTITRDRCWQQHDVDNDADERFLMTESIKTFDARIDRIVVYSLCHSASAVRKTSSLAWFRQLTTKHMILCTSNCGAAFQKDAHTKQESDNNVHCKMFQCCATADHSVSLLMDT